ncbi:MAG: hypothetical protein IKR62_01935, partial [Victivallales bacterium]|nr:hypothetical protein [Victivallales bacterium]
MGLLEDLTNLLGGSRTESDVAKDKQDAVDEAAKLDLAGLQDLIKKVMEMISSKTGELNGLQAQLKDLNPMD